MGETGVRKLVVTKWQYAYLLNMLFAVPNAKEYLDAHYEVAYTPEQMDVYLNLNERLGSLVSEQQVRVAPNPEIPGLRGLSYSISSVYIDEAYYPTADRSLYERCKADGRDASEWLEHRNFCTRALFECISGKAR